MSERERERGGESDGDGLTWTIMPIRSTSREFVKEAAAMKAGPARNRTPIANDATLFPHAMIRGCNAMNNPASKEIFIFF